MSKKTDNYTEADIHRFTDKDGIERVHIPWGMITGDIPDGVVYPTESLSRFWKAGDGLSVVGAEKHWKYPYRKKDVYGIIPADRIEIVTEHVEATVMDALQALVASGGKPVEGWKLGSSWAGEDTYNTTVLCGVDTKRGGIGLGFIGFNGEYIKAYGLALRPVTRVRIKAEAKPEPKFKVGDLVETTTTMHWRGVVAEIKTSSTEVYYTINDTAGEERWLHESNLKPWVPGYGFALDGNPVPPPPEGWEIVPEGDGIGVSCIYYAPDTQEWEEGMVNGSHAFVANRARAYARRVVKESLTSEAPATAEESAGVGELEKAFDKYWNGGSKHRAIDAFRAGVKWAKGGAR